MNIISDHKKDVRNSHRQPGGYECWYFDGISDDGKYSFVIKFYEGNPFSTRYNTRLKDSAGNPMPSEYPATRIAVYKNEEPIYFSFTEYESGDCTFSAEYPMVMIGNHEMRGESENGHLTYIMELNEILPNGDGLEAEFVFESSLRNNRLFDHQQKSTTGHHCNLIQPKADVKAEIYLNNEHAISFKGRGYHDHITGCEPMWKEFTDWYWGRFYFESATLVYYLMNREDQEQYRAWLIDSENSEILETFDQFSLVDKGLNIYGLKSARKIGLRSDYAEIQIQKEQVLDNTPFYQRFKSKAFLRMKDTDSVETKTGISEYLRPDRIISRFFRPFLNMRIYYKAEKPHWVQHSKILYRWMW